MAAVDHLNDTLFHGSPHVFQPGDTVHPTHSSTLSGNVPVAYASKSPGDAAFFGAAKGARAQTPPLFIGVHEVTPKGPTKKSGSNYATSPDGFEVGKQVGLVRTYNAPGLPTAMKDRWL